MNKLLQEDLHNVVRSLPKDIRRIMKTYGLMVGGGYIRETVAGQRPHDIDLLGPEEGALKIASMELITVRGNKARKLTTRNAITLVEPPRMTVQFITRWLFDDPVHLVFSFDFTVCQAVVYWNKAEGKWDSVVSPRFYKDLASRRLVYTAPARHEDAGGSLLRMRKFLGRGYHINAENMGKIIARMMNGVRDTALMWCSSEEERGAIIAGVLREVDPLHIVDGVDPIDVEHDEGEDDEGDTPSTAAPDL